MNHPRLLLIQLDPVDPPGPLADWLRGAGASVDVLVPPSDGLPDDLGGYQGLVCLGGAMGAYDDIQHPWLARVRALLAQATSNRVPTLAICLGAQLLAVATGGRVRQMPGGPEVGFRLVAKRDSAGNDPLFGELPATPDVVQFHTDEVHTLPPNAQHLAASPHCTNQAFRVGACGYGLQFHIETTPDVLTHWAKSAPETAATMRRGQLDPDRLAEAHEELAETWQPFAERFVRMAAGELVADPSGVRSLPLA
ncbi:MAG: type 1 glutamine amidotransferase [Sciscionella sp.]